MPTETSPPLHVIGRAEIVAGTPAPGRCTKSHRGAVAYDPTSGAIRGVGYNSPPAPKECAGTERCRQICGKICEHAEGRAIRMAAETRGVTRAIGERLLRLVHVKLGKDGRVAPGGPPKCWQCSRAALEIRLIEGVWLYEAVDEEWCPHLDLPRIQCTFCQGEACHACMADRSCAHDVLDRHQGLPIFDAHWRFYSVLEFHRIALRNSGLA